MPVQEPGKVNMRQLFFLNLLIMRPDYPQKLFADKRTDFPLLMEALAMLSCR